MLLGPPIALHMNVISLPWLETVFGGDTSTLLSGETALRGSTCYQYCTCLFCADIPTKRVSSIAVKFVPSISTVATQR